MTLSINKSLTISAGTPKTSGKIIVLHSTDDLEATAKNLATFEHRVWRTAQTFVHFGVDDKDIYQVGTPGYVAWGAGNVNRLAPVQMELCEFHDRVRALRAYERWIELAVTMADKYGVPRTLDDGNTKAGFKTHEWCSKTYGGSDHGDPYPWLAKIGISKAQLAADLKSGQANSTVMASAPKQAAKPAPKSDKLVADGDWGAATTRKLQALYGTPVDGVVSAQYPWGNFKSTVYGFQFDKTNPAGSLLIAQIQRALGIKPADGLMGPATIKAMQKRLGTMADGVISKHSSMVMAMQEKLNQGIKPF